MTQYEREEEDIQRRLESGELTNAQANQELRELQRDYRDEALEAAREAQERELSRW